MSVSSAVTVVLEGRRPLRVEVQALCSPAPPGSNGVPPTRMPSGVKRDRLFLLLAVLGKHTDMKPWGVDVHLNVTGGERARGCLIRTGLASFNSSELEAGRQHSA